MSYSVTIRGFASKKDAQAFYDWFEGAGEQDFYMSQELREDKKYLTDMDKKMIIRDKHLEFWVK